MDSGEYVFDMNSGIPHAVMVYEGEKVNLVSEKICKNLHFSIIRPQLTNQTTWNHDHMCIYTKHIQLYNAGTIMFVCCLLMEIGSKTEYENFIDVHCRRF